MWLTPDPGRFTVGTAIQVLGFAWMAGNASVACLGSGCGTGHDLQSFLNRPEDTLVVFPSPGGWEAAPLDIRRDHKLIVFVPGTVVRAAAGAFPRTKDCLLTLDGVHDVRVLGYGARLVMRKEEYRSGEWRHGIKIRGSTDIRIEGLRVDSSGGDGIYVGSIPWKGLPDSRRIVLEGCRLFANRRQGISVISAEDIVIRRCRGDSTSGTAPGSGIDFEPDTASEYLVGCVVEQCAFAGNQGPGALVWLGRQASVSRPLSILFRSCYFEGGSAVPAVRIDGFRSHGIRGGIEIAQSEIVGDGVPPVRIGDRRPDDAPVTIASTHVRMRSDSLPARGPGFWLLSMGYGDGERVAFRIEPRERLAGRTCAEAGSGKGEAPCAGNWRLRPGACIRIGPGRLGSPDTICAPRWATWEVARRWAR